MPSKLTKEKHLFVFEGSSAEAQYQASLEKKFLGECFAIKCVFDAEIYQLYKQMKSDDFETDIVSLLKKCPLCFLELTFDKKRLKKFLTNWHW